MFTVVTTLAVYAALLFANFFILAIVPELKLLVTCNIVLVTVGLGARLYLKNKKEKNAH